jgi:DNA topoisomerase-3
LTEADAQKVAGWIKAITQGQLMDLQPFIGELRKRWPVKLDKRFVNDKEVEDHAALTPTENPAKNLHGDLLKVRDLEPVTCRSCGQPIHVIPLTCRGH